MTKIPKEEVDGKVARQILKEAGFIRIDGLTVRTDGKKTKIRRSFSTSPGKWEISMNNAVVAMRNRKGELWIGLAKLIHLVDLGGLIIKWKSFFVPLSNGEKVDVWDIYRRWRDPDWDPPEGNFSLKLPDA